MFRSDTEHQTNDWQGIHQQICPLIETLRTLPPAFGSDDVIRRNATGFIHIFNVFKVTVLPVRKNQMAIVKIASTEANKQLVIKNYERSIPGGLQVLRFSTLLTVFQLIEKVLD